MTDMTVSPGATNVTVMQVTNPFVDLLPRADHAARRETRLLYGERFNVLGNDGDFAYGKAVRDGYEGFVPWWALCPRLTEPTHRVKVPEALLFPDPDFKSRWPTTGQTPSLGFNSLVAVSDPEPEWTQVGETGWMESRWLAPVDELEQDFVEVMLRFLGRKYLWGARGVYTDCSALVQDALQSYGVWSPRNSFDMQMMLGEIVCMGGNPPTIARGDLVFWKNHVAVMIDATYVVHATKRFDSVVRQTLREARQERLEDGTGDIACIRRVTRPIG